MSAMKGLIARRRGYLSRSLTGPTPLARPVMTYCFCSSSKRLARKRRIIEAVPEVPMTTTGTQRWAKIDATLPQLQGWSMYTGSMRPPIEVPNQTLAE